MTVQDYLNACADPIFFVDSAGKLLWANSAGLKTFSPAPKALCQLIPPEAVKRVTSVEGFAQLPVQVMTGSGVSIPQIATVLDISPVEPDQQRWLVTLSSPSVSMAGLERREQFLSNVSHDLKNPLGAIFGFADALLDTNSSKGLTPQQREVLIRIRSTSMRCIDMVRNYQLLSSLSTSVVPSQLKPLDLNSVVQSVLDYAWREDPSVPRLECRLAGLPLPIQMERAHLERIVANLLSNAQRYTPAGETVTIETFASEAKVALRVNNRGSYIAPDERAAIFERHTRGSTSAGTAGSGLGLYIINQLVKTVGGAITVESGQDSGTTFTVLFPRANG